MNVDDHPILVLDDDPTGTQSMAGVPVVLRPDEATIREAAVDDPPAIHLVTNSRAWSPDEARRRTAGAARAGRAVLPEAELVLRGDSTLRGHVWEEYDALREVAYPGEEPVLLLAPALPEAGRITVDGVHLLETDGERQPLHETAYARDPAFSYPDADLLSWADHRSGGAFARSRGRTLHLDDLRSGGGTAVASLLAEVAAGTGTAVCAADAVTLADLHRIMDGYRQARAAGVPVILRTAPTGAGVLTGATATGTVDLPADPDGVLVVCGSYVPRSVRQLGALVERYPGSLVELSPGELERVGSETLAARLAGELAERIDRDGLAVLAIERPGQDGPGDLDRQAAVAEALVAVVRHLERTPGVVITKGGVTSATVIRDGLGAAMASVIGPVVSGVGRWDVAGAGGRVSCLVVPGNVGGDDILRGLVDALHARGTDGGQDV